MKSERETGDGAGKLQIEDPSRGRKLRGEQGQEMKLILLKCVCGGGREKRRVCQVPSRIDSSKDDLGLCWEEILFFYFFIETATYINLQRH